MPLLDALYGPPTDTSELSGAINQASDRITQILSRNRGPSLGDVGKAALRSWGGQGYGQSLDQIFAQRQQQEVGDLNLALQNVDLMQKKIELAAQGNPTGQKFKFLWDAYTEGMEPQQRIQFMQNLESDPEDFNDLNGEQLFARASQGLSFPTEAPETAGGMMWDPESEQFLPIPGYAEQQGQIAAAGRPQTNVLVPGSPPTGYMWADESFTSLVPIPGGPATRMTPEEAAKTEALAQGLQDIGDARSLMITQNESGEPTVNRELITTMTARVPFSEGRKVYGLLYNAIEAKLRSESGAAVPPEEVERIAKRFVPSPLDSDQEVITKMDRLEQYLRGTLDRIVPPDKAEDAQRLIEKYGLEQ